MDNGRGCPVSTKINGQGLHVQSFVGGNIVIGKAIWKKTRVRVGFIYRMERDPGTECHDMCTVITICLHKNWIVDNRDGDTTADAGAQIWS